ncbi:MAG: flagellar type III secretion system pore protein FliP [Gammaproteobacteria bacterium]|nr:flagellar type III secretion system pore protein FliP [Gammaproteobacteria bacterium]NNF60047.1 flagellar type III secretion system pore protein FliP [Gammaproteobacteria bacterium]NNM19978.1 flagellar type III secretion system pore protein FliP [Gammaproteobacteria bacterium]
MRLLLLAIALLSPLSALAEPGIPALTIETSADGAQNYTLTIQVLAIMTLLTMLPAALLTMTSFTRVIIVLAILRQALGTPQSPPNQVLLGLALFLTMFIMSPVLNNAWINGVQPYMDGDTEAVTALKTSTAPFREFMINQTRDSDLALFARIAGDLQFDTPADVPLSLLVPAFVTSELKTAFQIGFLVFIPFLIIDLVVASVLMSMGMMMLSPMLISLPFKIMLFVLVDGWSLLMETVAASFFV